jgi:hypothetical protein
MVWKAWATPKVKFFSWLAIRNRIWTVDRLEKRVWDNCGLCQLYKQTQESAAHLFFQCQFTKRLWNLVISWLGIANIHNKDWVHGTAIEEWWTMMACSAKPNRKAIASITMLMSWAI